MMYDALALDRQRVDQERLSRRAGATVIRRAATEAVDRSSAVAPRWRWVPRRSLRTRAACAACAD